MRSSWTSSKPALTYCIVLLLFFVPIFFLTKAPVEPTIEIPIEPPPLQEELPDFANILDVREKKETFFDFIEPFVDEVNLEILSQRQRVQSIRDKVLNSEEPTASDLRFLSTLSELYELETEELTSMEFLNVLLRRVDKIPASLALAQAANESAWGTSRFAQDGKNFFGQWCYSDGCGLVPSRRREGATHEVRSFSSVKESVQSYIHNLNTFPSYQMLRRIRQQLRQQDRPINGISLADGLESYSARGLDYVDELQQMIYSNELSNRDKPN